MTSDVQSVENQSASRTPKFSKGSVNNASIKAIKGIVKNETNRKIKKKLARYGIQIREPDPPKQSTEQEPINIEVRASPRIVDVRVLYLDKDGTNYDLLVIEIEGNFSFGMMGTIVKHGYLVLEGLNRRAYLFHEFIPDGRYIADKLSGGRELHGKDIENIMLLMKQGLKPKRLKTSGQSITNLDFRDTTRAGLAKTRNIYPCGER